ncbi:MAG: NTP transferase domain-containing protein [Pseudoxanthomonas sp.]
MMLDYALQGSKVTLGILAGGRASRLGGRDKAWLQRDGVPQVVRIARRFSSECGTVLISANGDLDRYLQHGLKAVPDTIQGIGPIAGLQSLALACTTPWLLTLPVDIVDASDCLLRTLVAEGRGGAVAEDDDGLQPLVALYACDELRAAVTDALAAGEHAVQALQARLVLPRVRFAGFRFGNLNTPEDLRAAGVDDG